MSATLRTIILNTDPDYSKQLRATLLAVDGIKITGEVDEPALFETAVTQSPAELAVVNLDPEPELIILTCEQIIEKNPDITFFAISESNNPDIILKAMRAGFREFLLRPIDENQLKEAIDRIAKFTSVKKHQGKLICCFGTIGGAGTTTIATNLACELAQFTRRGTIVVDLDLFYGHVATLLDITPQFTIADLCQTLDAIDVSMIEKAVIHHETKTDVLARPLHFAQAQAISTPNITTLLNTLIEMYDYVVCDGPTRNDAMGPAVIELADISLMIVTPTVPSIRNVDRILREMEREGYNLDRVKLVISKYTQDEENLTINDIEEALNRKIFATVPYDLKTVNSAINTGVPLIRSFPKSKVREAIYQLALKIYDPNQLQKKQAENKKSSLFARLLNK